MSDELVFLEEEDDPASAESPVLPPWKVLIVDDEVEVHTVTRMVLDDFVYCGRKIHFLSAYSGGEAQGVLSANPDVAVVLLDVVMETDDAGLRLVRFIREELGNTDVRIIMRTGQPGQAPERDIVARYDINDYKAKTELTEPKLWTTMLGALRAYEHISALRASEQALNEARATLEARVAERTKALQTSEMRLRSILDASVFPILVVDGSGTRALFLNDRAAEMFGASVGEVYRNGLPHIWVSSGDRRRVLRLARERGRVLDHEAQLRGQEGEPFWALISAITMDYEGELAVLLSFNDISARKRMEEELKRLALTDSLTGAGNRRHMQDRGADEIARARRHDRALSVLMLDIDHFKQVNDTFGHAVGDDVLRRLAQTCTGQLRDVDVFCRFGGEEFAVLMPDTDLERAIAAAERLRHAVGTLVFQPPETNETLSVTISLGAASLTDDDVTIESILDRADEALYRAKRGGRNRVEAE